MNDDFHIGRIIRHQLDVEGRRITWFAQKLDCDRSNVYKIFRKRHLDCELLMRISKLLEYDFFAFYSDELKRPCATGISPQH